MMQQITSIVYYLDKEGKAQGTMVDGEDVLGRSLKEAERLRNAGYQHVTISTENSMSVGKRGVDVTDDSYNWKKRRP
jgi:hypothetical protein